MTLPASPPITLSQITAEFGAPAGTLFTQMTRGGLYVPVIATTNGIPSSPPINMLQFLGTAKKVVDLQFVSQGAFSITPADATINVQWLPNGFCTCSQNNGAPFNLYQWLLPGSVNSDYAFMADGQTGDLGFLTGTAFGVWTTMSSGISFTLTNTSNLVNSKQVDFSIHIRRVVDSVVIDNNTASLIAEVDA